jgi:type I restriction enzyme M protein
MTNGDLRNKIDKLWTDFWTGGITNPLTVIEQITYLFFCRMLDEAETNREKAAQRTGKPVKALFFAKDQQELRWSHFRMKSGEALLALVRDKIFPFLRDLDKSRDVNGDDEGAKIGLGSLMKDAQLLIVKPGLLKSAITAVDEMEMASTDAKGDLYEYLLSKLSTAGINGQFRTPRHILETMVELVKPKPTDFIGDPACGTAGFLVKAMEYLRRKYTTPEMVYEGDDGKSVYIGDQLTPWLEHINNHMFRGFDFDLTMLRLSAMNMMLHGVEGRCIFFQDSLSESFAQNYPNAKGHFDIILANPPFKGNLDKDDIAQELTRKVKSGKTELLFLVRMLEMLKLGGRCAVIVPDGVLFGSSKAHIALRQLLVNENQLDGVVSLPSGVFKPYAGVSTAILLFTKGGKTGDVFFFDVQADGYSLDDKRNKIEDDDLPELLERWENRDPKKDMDRTAKDFFVTADEIREHKYDLSLNKYKKQTYVAETYDPPLMIMENIEKLEQEIVVELRKLRGMLG